MEEEQSVLASEEQRRICQELAEHYRAIISLLGDDPDREGLRKTPERTAKAMMQLTRDTVNRRRKLYHRQYLSIRDLAL